MQCLRCLDKLITVSMKTISLSCCKNIFRRHFLKLRISSQTLLSTNNAVPRDNRLKLWQHQVSEVSYSNNQMLWP
uniref:Uncharacterized protein n=1 Tax=Oryza meridionalis TaxID=40149 RepID=A0A0E0D6P2_9ORYZ